MDDLEHREITVLIPCHESKKKYLGDVFYNIANQNILHKRYRAVALINNSSKKFLRRQIRQTHDLAGRFRMEFRALDLGKIVGKFKGDILAKVINAGIDLYEKKTDWFLIVGADIIIGDNTIQNLMRAFEEFKDCGLSCLTCFYRWDKGGIKPIMEKALPKDAIITVDDKVPMVLLKSGYLDAKMYYKEDWFKALAGDGAMLFPRWITDRIRWNESSYEDHKIGSDFKFCMDINEKLGLWTYINTRNYTPHLDQDEEGELVVW